MSQLSQIPSVAIGVPEAVLVFVVLEGLFLLEHRNTRGGAVALSFALVLLFVSRFLTAKAKQIIERPQSYESWLISKISESSDIYGGKLSRLPSSSYIALIESEMYPQLKLELSEFMLLQILAVGAGIDIMLLLESSFSWDAAQLLKVNGKIYKPKNSLARLLLGMATDADFSDVPIRRWLVQGRPFLFELQKTDAQLSLELRSADKVETKN